MMNEVSAKRNCDTYFTHLFERNSCSFPALFPTAPIKKNPEDTDYQLKESDNSTNQTSNKTL